MYLCSWQQKPKHEHYLYFIIEGKPEKTINYIDFNITVLQFLFFNKGSATQNVNILTLLDEIPGTARLTKIQAEDQQRVLG